MKLSILKIIKCITSVLFFIVPFLSFAQQLVKHGYSSPIVGDTIKYNVWLPKDYNSLEKYPSIFINSYGALSSNGMLAAAYINNFMNNLPKAIVIEILSGDMPNMGYSYESGMVDSIGKKFISSLKTEIIPQIERDYHITKFRAFIGQSYSASYANYLFQHEPGLFNGYVLFTPEKLEENQPPFEVSEQLRKYYNSHPTLYYIAPAGNDIPRRIEYAKDIEKKLMGLDSNTLHFKYELFKEADHNSIVSYGLLPAIKYLFSFYDFEEKKPGSLADAFKMQQKQLISIYGLELPVNSRFQFKYINVAAERKDIEGMDLVATYFQDDKKRDNALMLFNTAYTYYDSFKDYSKAEKYFRMSIESGKKSGKAYTSNGYSWLSTMYIDGLKDFDKAWSVLEEAYDYTKSSIYKYRLGVLAVKSGKNLEQGINNLNFFLLNKPTTFPERLMAKEEAAYLLLAKCYYMQKNYTKAKVNLARCLKLNSNYAAAISWKNEVKL
ncbi:hypothetical protein EA772_14270 [Pedobacter sp. G11]|nr:hypothetical protein EA772_14270 [Pedobacter sp. G11]